MIDYKPYLVANFRSGFNESLEPWLLPRDAFQVLQNSHLYRGVIDKINGYDIFAKMSYRTIVQLGVPDGVTTTFSATLSGPLASNTFLGQSAINSGMTLDETFMYSADGSATVLNLTSSGGGTGTVDISNPLAPVVSLTFNTAPVSKVVGGVQYNTVTFAYDSPPSPYRPIMGIKPYYELSGNQDIMVFDTRRLGKVTPITSIALGTLLDLENIVSEVPHQTQVQGATFSPAFNGTTTTFTGTITGPIVPGMVEIPLFDSSGQYILTGGDLPVIAFDDGTGALTGDGISSGFINYFTGNWTITFSVAPASGDSINTSTCEYGNVFTGGISNFFSVANWQTLATENSTEENQNLLFCTNNVDLVRYWNGSCLMILNTNLSEKPPNDITYDISTCLFVVAYQGYLLLMSPIVGGVPLLNLIYWSAIEDPLNFTQDNFLPSPTSEPIRAQGQINNDLIVRFAKSERAFRFTQDINSPFRWDGLNSVFQCDTSYSTINYDYYLTTVGKPAIVASDGRNVIRKDELIPDFTDPNRIPQQTPALFMDQTSISQCYGERFDDLKEGWLCYTSATNSSDPAVVSPADSILAFNYQDEGYAVYTFPFSCLGFGTVISTLVWGNDYREWGSISDTWGDYTITDSGLLDLSGDQFGNVFELNESYTLGPEKTSVAITAITNASSAQVTSTAHDLVTGDQIVIQGVIGMTSGPANILNQIFVVTVVDANNFTIPVDTTTWALYVSGGLWFTAPVLLDVITKNFTPFAEEGQMTRLGFVDLLVSANNDTTIRVQFFKDDQLSLDASGNPINFYQETPLTFFQTTSNSTINQTKVWKRVYCGAVAKEHTLRFYQNLADFTSDTLDQPVRIHAMCLYMKPAGRIFN